LLQKRCSLLCLATLLGFKDKAPVPIKVDKAGAGRAIGIVEVHSSLEHITVGFGFASRRVWPGQPEDGAKLDQEQLIVGAL